MACELGKAVSSVSKKGDRLVVSTDKEDHLECDMVLLSVGIHPENRLAKEADLKIGERGGIWVDDSMRTSDPHIYAVGDAVEVRDLITGHRTTSALAGPANKQGRIAADNVMGRRSFFKGILGTSVVKIFDLTTASTGINEKMLQKDRNSYNILKADMEIIHQYELGETGHERDVLIDLRTPVELKKRGLIDGAVHIPIDELRAKLDELDRDKQYILYCAVGVRSYLGYRILLQHGFEAKNLSGGYTTYLASKGI